jgi:hypothetical protein
MKYQPKRHRGTLALISGLVLGVLATSAVFMYFYKGQAQTGEPPIPSGVAMTSWFDNGHGGRYLLQVAQGRSLAQGERVIGSVASDTDCDPDAQGLSHCHNGIELTNGDRITVIDTHNMSVNRCLKPGERIALTGIGGPWIMGTVSGG